MSRDGISNRRAFVVRAMTAAAAASLPIGQLVAADREIQSAQTRIYVKDMHCSACAKKIARKLYTVQGVRHVKAVVKSNAAIVTPEQKKVLSPLALWEAVEAAGFVPVRLHGPNGSFSAKPKA